MAKQPTLIEEYIRAFARRHHKEALLDEAQALRLWKERTDPAVLAHVVKAEVRGGILFVKVDSPSLRNDLRYSSDQTRDAINGLLEQEVLKAIAIL